MTCTRCAWLFAFISAAPRLGLRTDMSLVQTKKPTVYVSDFLPGFPDEHPPRIADFGNFSMQYIYGDKICTGQEKFVSFMEYAPTNFCHRKNNHVEMALSHRQDDAYDEYAMERIMLGKWKRSPLLCTGDDEWCRTHADIVVVPSLTLHRMVMMGFSWESQNDNVEEIKGMVDRYWELVMTMFHRPEENHIPYIVVHSPYAWDKEAYVYLLHALAKQPDAFKGSVILPSTGSNLMNADAKIFGTDWSSGAHRQLLQRAQLRAKGVRDPTPLLITVPYPTSITEPANFLESSGSYRPSNRRILISMFATVRKNPGADWIRGILMDRFDKMEGAIVTGLQDSRRFVCASGYDEKSMCGMVNPTAWDISVNSQFCIEPAGDTLCRSHLYVSLLSGCIPVIVDGGHDAYTEENESTWWAWRKSPPQESTHDAFHKFFVKYKKFTVVYSAEDVKNGNVDIMKELKDMPTADPKRFESLQKNVQKYAPMMRYAMDDCTPPSCNDAFSMLHQLVVKAHWLQ